MGIYTGIESLFFALGALTTLLVFGLVYLRRNIGVKAGVMILAGLGGFLLLFTIAWSGSSILEGEHQAATMGLLCFGLPVLLIFGVCRRLVSKPVSKEKSVTGEGIEGAPVSGAPS